MDNEPEDLSWETLSAEILSGMREWRLQHPKATMREIEEGSPSLLMMQARGIPTQYNSRFDILF